MQIRAASEAERNAWNVPAMQATIDSQATTISGQTSAIATLMTNLSATNTTATDAASAAAAAATLAGSKSKVIWGASTPVAGDQREDSVWFDTTSGINAPKRWLGGAWVIARDKVAVDAAAAAAAAQSTADAVAANLATNYLTATSTNNAIAAAKTELTASIQPYQAQKLHADFRFGDYYWAANYTQSVATLPAAAYPTAYGEVTLETVAGIGTVLQKGAGASNRIISERTHRPFVVGQKMRFRMKTRLTANPTTGTHSTRLYFAMTDSAGAYLGITGIIANFLGTVVANGWVIKEFVFDPQAIKAAGAYAATAVNWRCMVQLDGLNSAVQQVEWIELEDVTTDTSLQASITSILATDVSALTGTALATLLTQLAVGAGGTSAWITSQTSAVATLNGNAAASYVLRVGASGVSAGLELVAANDPISGAASVLKLSAKHLDILASSVRISDSGNIFPDFDMLDPLFYSSSDGAVFSLVGTATATLGRQFLNIAANAAAKSVDTGWFSVEPNTEYLVSGAAFMASTAAGQGTATLTIETGLVDAAGAVSVVTSTTVQTRTDQNYAGILTAINLLTGATARRARFKLTRAAGGAGGARAGGFKVQKKAGASLLVDGLFAVTRMAIFGDILKSTGYTPNATGWMLGDDGRAELNELLVREDMIVNGAVSRKYHIYKWADTIISGVGNTVPTYMGGTITANPVARRGDSFYPDNPVLVTVTGKIGSAGSGTAYLALYRYNTSTSAWVYHDNIDYLAYSAGSGSFTMRYVDTVGYSGYLIVSGDYRLAAYKAASGNADFTLTNVICTIEQLNK